MLVFFCYLQPAKYTQIRVSLDRFAEKKLPKNRRHDDALTYRNVILSWRLSSGDGGVINEIFPNRFRLVINKGRWTDWTWVRGPVSSVTETWAGPGCDNMRADTFRSALNVWRRSVGWGWNSTRATFRTAICQARNSLQLQYSLSDKHFKAGFDTVFSHSFCFEIKSLALKISVKVV